MKSIKNGKPPQQDFPKETDGYNNNSKKELLNFCPKFNKNLCPCYLYQILGPEEDYPKYESINILVENGDSIWSPEHETNYSSEGFEPENRGQVFINADLVSKIVVSSKSKGVF